jgi:hypothetical protein
MPEPIEIALHRYHPRYKLPANEELYLDPDTFFKNPEGKHISNKGGRISNELIHNMSTTK